MIMKLVLNIMPPNSILLRDF